MPHLFDGDSYATPATAPRLALDRLLGWTRWPFYAYVMRTVAGGGRVAVRGHFDSAEFQRCSETIVRVTEGCGGRLRVTGLEHLAPASGPAVIIGNHMSFLETFALPAMILPRRPVSFVIKRSLLNYPALGKILGALEPVALTRTNPREDLRTILEEGVQRLEAGRSVVVFPQSTRRPDFAAAHFSSIGAKLAQRAGRPIIPVAIRTDFVGNGRLLKDFGPLHRDREIRFAFGPPIVMANPRQAQQATVDYITGELRAWGVPCA